MSRRFAVSIIVLVAQLSFSGTLAAQTPPDKQSAIASDTKWNNVPPDKSTYSGKKAGPAPRRDLSGIWDGTAEGGIQPRGANEYADNTLRVRNDVPLTALGRAARSENKPEETERPIPAANVNDPLVSCEPQGFPRMDLNQLRVVEIAQTENQVVYVDQFYNNWRVIWTDGRELPKDPEPRWNGYSVGKWVDDHTLVVQTVGLDERTWLDNAGRPHSDVLRIEERFHRVDSDTLQLTVTIDDPKFYTQRWVALNKFVLHRLPDDFDMSEIFCTVPEK